MRSCLTEANLAIKLERAFKLVEVAVESGRLPCGVLGIVTCNGFRGVRSMGFAQTFPMKRRVSDATWFDLASLTKVIFTTPRILALAEVGEIELDAPLASILPDLGKNNANKWVRQITFRQCLGHLTPFPTEEPFYRYGQDPAQLRSQIFNHEWRVGSPVYSDINFILLGLVLERLREKRIWEMDAGPGFAFGADPALAAATEDCSWRGRVLCGEVHDENCAALQGAGHAGLFGTVASVLDFAQGLLDGSGASTGVIELMQTRLSATRTHGWETPFEGWSGGGNCSAATVGHTGFTGTGLWIDFDAGFAWTLLTNRVHPSRNSDSGIFALRQAVANALNS